MNLLHVLPLSFFVWCESVWPGLWIKQAMWVFATVETIHIMALAVLLGTIFLLDLRLLGLIMQRVPLAELGRSLNPWTLTSIVVMVVSGAMLFTSEAVRLYQSAPFFYKMVLLFLALVIHFSVFRRATQSDNPEKNLTYKVAACLSLFCWFGVAFAGRAIAFL